MGGGPCEESVSQVAGRCLFGASRSRSACSRAQQPSSSQRCRYRWAARPGVETTRGRCRQTVLRAAPCLFGLYTVVAVLFHSLPAKKRTGAISWPGKATVTFSDALWAETVLPQAGDATAPQKLPKRVWELLLTTLATAA